jgi:hypothetical protein
MTLVKGGPVPGGYDTAERCGTKKRIRNVKQYVRGKEADGVCVFIILHAS